jgi:hypothetical protein
MFIEINGNRIHHVETGEGSPIVFLHGLGLQLHHLSLPKRSAAIHAPVTETWLIPHFFNGTFKLADGFPPFDKTRSHEME